MVIQSNLRWKELLNPQVLLETQEEQEDVKIKPFTEADAHETALCAIYPQKCQISP